MYWMMYVCAVITQWITPAQAAVDPIPPPMCSLAPVVPPRIQHMVITHPSKPLTHTTNALNQIYKNNSDVGSVFVYRSYVCRWTVSVCLPYGGISTQHMNAVHRYQQFVVYLVLLFWPVCIKSCYLYIMWSCPEKIQNPLGVLHLAIMLIGALMCIPLVELVCG